MSSIDLFQPPETPETTELQATAGIEETKETTEIKETTTTDPAPNTDLFFTLYTNRGICLACREPASSDTTIQALRHRYFVKQIENNVPVNFYSGGEKLEDDTILANMVRGVDPVNQSVVYESCLTLVAHVVEHVYEPGRRIEPVTVVKDGMPQKFKAKILFENDSELEITVPIDATGHYIKQAVFDRRWIPIARQRLLVVPQTHPGSPLPAAVEISDSRLHFNEAVSAILQTFVRNAEAHAEGEEDFPPQVGRIIKYLPGIPVVTMQIFVQPHQSSVYYPIFVRTLIGRTYTLEVTPKHTIQEIKVLLMDRNGIPPDHQRLIYGGKQLDPLQTLDYYNIPKEATLQLLLRLR